MYIFPGDRIQIEFFAVDQVKKKISAETRLLSNCLGSGPCS